jgi:hypothetical protein
MENDRTWNLRNLYVSGRPRHYQVDPIQWGIPHTWEQKFSDCSVPGQPGTLRVDPIHYRQYTCQVAEKSLVVYQVDPKTSGSTLDNADRKFYLLRMMEFWWKMIEPEISGICMYPVHPDITRLIRYNEEFPIPESRNSQTAVYHVNPGLSGSTRYTIDSTPARLLKKVL